MATRSNTADDILRCAQSLILQGGYDGFSYADIAKVVGIRNASIHHHFPGKADLVRALVVRYREQVDAGIAELERSIPDAVARLRAYTDFWAACITDRTMPLCLCALLATQMPVLPDEVAREVRAHFRSLSAWLTSVLERGAREGRLQLATTASAEAEALMAGVHGAMLSARAYGDPAVFERVTTPLLNRLAR